MKVNSIHIRNFKSIQELDEQLDGQSVYVIGSNGAGKSSFIQAIYLALTGKDLPPNPITKGKKDGEIEIVIADNKQSYTIELKFTEKNQKGYLSVKSEGAELSSPRTVLNNLIGHISFDPFDFLSWDGKKQVKFLKELTGLDFEHIDRQLKTLEDDRKLINAKIKDLTGALNESNLKEEDFRIFAKEQDILLLQEEINEANEANNNVLKGTNILAGIEAELNQKQKDILLLTVQAEESATETLAEIKRLEAEIERVRQAHEKKLLKIEDVKERTNTEIFTLRTRQTNGMQYLKENQPIDTIPLQERFKNATQFNKKVNEVRTMVEKKSDLESQKQLYADYGKNMEQLRTEKLELIAAANIPVPGLGIEDDYLTLDGLPMEGNQVPKSKIIEAGVRLVMAMNPGVKIVRITDGSLLDQETLSGLVEMVNKEGYQAFIEMVDRQGGELSINIIED